MSRNTKNSLFELLVKSVGLLLVSVSLLYTVLLAVGLQIPIPEWFLLYVFVPLAFVFAAIALLVRFDMLPCKGEKRRLAGECVACGYDMRGTMPVQGWIICPECGYKTPAFGKDKGAE